MWPGREGLECVFEVGEAGKIGQFDVFELLGQVHVLDGGHGPGRCRRYAGLLLLQLLLLLDTEIE